MKRTTFLFLAVCLTVIPLWNTRINAQRNTPQQYLRERGVTRVQSANIALTHFNNVAADEFQKKQRLGPQAPPRMKLDLFPDVSVNVDITDVQPAVSNAVAWYGTVDGLSYGTATFLLTGNALIGSINRGDGKIYEIRTAEDGTQWTVEIDQALFPEEEETVPTANPDAYGSYVSPADVPAASDDGSTIDVMVLYTPSARLAAGSTLAIQQRVQLGIAETNQGYVRSGVIQQVRLVHMEEINYVESSKISTDLQKMQTLGDPFHDQVQTLRNIYGADLVSLWVNTTENTCGIGSLLLDPTLPASVMAPYGNSVAELSCATGYYTFGHEMGHNMGAHHAKDDLDNGNPPVGAYPYSNGYKHLTAPKFRTIMAYDTNCGDLSVCPRILNWSNPSVTYNGTPTGIDPNSSQSAANYLTLNNTRSIIANYRQTVVTTQGGPDNTGPLVTISSHSNNQLVLATSITLSGTATDAARGDNGISSVTVNGVSAVGGAASSNGIASWSITLNLNSGSNTIVVVAKDNSPNLNASTSTITITATIPSSATASTYHVFPQFGDGVLGDGTFYRTTLMFSNVSGSATANCTFRLYGLTVNGSGSFPYVLSPGSSIILPLSSTQPYKSGYATLQCSSAVEAQLLYSFYAPSGAKLSEATVFSSPPAAWLQLTGDNRGGSRIALAIANDSDSSRTYSIAAYDSNGSSRGSVNKTLSARSNYAGFLDEIISLPADYWGLIYVTSGNGTASMIGLRYTGVTFTTIPQIIRSSVAATASTYHVFPQFADGRLSNGSYYKTTIMMSNPSDTGGSCTLKLYGLTVNGGSSFLYSNWSSGSWTLTTSIASTQDLKTGYATMSCSMAVEAQLLYSFYAANGTKISEATVFSSPSAQNLQVLADNREGAQLGLAVANDTDQSTTYTLTAYNADGVVVATATRQIAPRTSAVGFLSDFFTTPLPANFYGQVLVSGAGGTSSIIGLRFTGDAFTTIPEAIR